RPWAARGRDQPAPGGDGRRGGELRRRRRRRGGGRGGGDREGHRQLLRRRAAADQGPEVGAGARAHPPGHRGGGAPGLLRAPVARRYPVGMATTAQSVADVCRAAQRASRSLSQLDTGTKDRALAAIATEAALGAGIPAGAIGLVAGGGREEMAELATQDGVVDLIVPRGGEGLKAALEEVATVPVIYAASGNCHVYVDAGADFDMAHDIVINAKTQRPGVCNSVETLLVHRDAAPAFLPRMLGSLREAGVELRADARTKAAAGELADSLLDVSDEDWDTEFLAMVLAAGMVDS